MVKVSLIGAGSRSFGPATIRDVLLSAPLADAGVHLVLMDVDAKRLARIERYARFAIAKLGREVTLTATTDLAEAVRDTDFVVTAIERRKDISWAQDFQIPRKHGFRQIYGENGGPGSHFHALRGFPLLLEVAKAMEVGAPNATLLNFTNPLHKLTEAVTRLSSTPIVGMCHGVYMGLGQIGHLLERPTESLNVRACGINHFTFFQEIRDKETGADLYPELKARELKTDPLYDWHEIALSRVLFHRFGLYPSPGTNHIGEYIVWADEFFGANMHWYYDPAFGHPWETGIAPEFVYSMGATSTDRPLIHPAEPEWEPEDEDMHFSGEPAVPLMEAISQGVPNRFLAVNIPNAGHIPNLPDGLIVEVPGYVENGKVMGEKMAALPEPLAALMRTQATIHQLLVEAYVEKSKEKLLHALLLEPTVTSYRNAVSMLNEMLALQADLLPELK